jgi:Ca2+-binding RTX toxin-like protein
VVTLRSPGNPAAEWGLPNTTSDFAVAHLSVNFFVSETDTLDSLTVFNDGSAAAIVGALSGTAVTGLGMGASGVSYGELETVEILLGTGVDTFTVTGTATGAITAVHGGGGGDRLTITGGGGPGSPLLVYGDTTQDRSRYTSAGATPLPGAGFSFAVDGDDSIDASTDQQSVAIYGGGGQDVIFGSQAGDHLAGGGGNDEIHGQGGSDHIYGDSGFNQDLGTRLDRATNQILKVVTVETTGNDKIFGDVGDDIAFGDHGIIAQTAGIQRILTTGNVIGVQTTNVTSGGDDDIQGGADNDVLLGGKGNDRIDGNGGQDLAFGDHAILTGRAVGVMTSPRVRTLTGTQFYDANGNPQVTAVWQTPPGALPAWANWLITLVDGNFGNDYLAGGGGNDSLFGQSGDDSVQGDGAISLTVSATLPSADDFAGPAQDGDDYVEGGSGNDLIFGNLGQDDLIGGSSDLFGFNTASQRADGADIIFGGSGTAIARNDLGDVSPAGHARDADTILGDNGDILRVVGANGVATSAFLTFNYDNYGSAKIIPRVFQTLDYTKGTGSASDLGGNDVVHGERGDDIIHGETGNDILFGEGQDDQIIGGAGQDRIYGGAGEDSLLGDDGRFIISRNGLTEPLYGVTTVNAQTNLTLPGPFTGAWEYITGRLNSSVRLLSPALGGNDLIFGGLGDDFIHAGTGNDAVSGAEAQAAWYNSLAVGAGYYSTGGFSIANQNDPLGYNATTRKLAAYDANNPLAKIPNFFLNFDATDTANNKIDDGKDRVFGDDGHDWLVGGTDNDRLWGGKGDDLIHADDNLTTNGGLNNQPDSRAFADRDFVYGGDGLDVMIANTGGDRMFDWGGEFNSYVVPFSPFGEPTIYRSPSPQIQQFLLALGKASGADQSMTEPNGELALFTQADPQWQSNHGTPRDPQPGNIGGTQRDAQGGPEDDRLTNLPLVLAPVAAPAVGSSIVANSTDVTLNTIFVSADPSNPSTRALIVGGSNAADTILVRQGSSSAYLDVVVNGVDKGQFAIASTSGAIGRIIVYGHDGNDSITVNTNVQIDAVLYGEAGDDTLTGGGGNSVLDGGIGNDILTAYSGRNVLIGGLGQDKLSGGKNSNLLIGGSYKYSTDLSSLWGLMAVWKGSASYSQRVASVRSGGIDALFAVNNLTVTDDKTVDFIFGGLDQDWYWLFGLDSTDKIKSGVIVN